MKSLTLALGLSILVYNAKGQQTINNPGIVNFDGIWQYANGTDTININCFVRYLSAGGVQMRIAQFYYTYKSGNATIWDNFSNYAHSDLSDFYGSKPFGSNYDSLVVGGRDRLLRKSDEGYFVLLNNKTQLKWKRNIGIHGGGLQGYSSGQGPLPGYTLPSELIFTKLEFTEMRPAN